MMSSVPIVPFLVKPKKEWHNDSEKKPRVHIEEEEEEEEERDYGEEFIDDDMESVSSYSTKSSIDSMEEHMKKLLPGEVNADGERNEQKPDLSLILDDLRVVKKKRDWWYYATIVYQKFSEARTRERLRRKHYLLREFEQRVAKYYEQEQKDIAANIKRQERAVLRERYQSAQRLKRNSKKKVDKMASVNKFTEDLIRRDHEKIQMDYRVRFLSRWAVEGTDRVEQEEEEAARQKALADMRQANADLLAHRNKLIEEDAAILTEDKRVSQEVQKMMIQYGMASYGRKPDDEADARLDYLLDTGNALAMKQRGLKAKAEEAAAEAPESLQNEVNTRRTLKLTLRRGIDLDKILKGHKRGKHSKNKVQEYASPFAEDLSSSGDVTTLKGSEIGEVGALSLASEFSRGLCPMLEHLDLKGCSIRTEGAGKLFVGIKMANLVSLRVLNLKGNFLGPHTLAYLKNACQSGVFMNLQILVLNENELGDDGITHFLEIVMEGHFLNLFEIHMEHNSITDYGFNKLVIKMSSVKEIKCPNIERINVSNNSITGKMKRKHKPLPGYFSV